MKLEDKIFSITSEEEFEKIALDIYSFQIKNCPVYQDYVSYLNWKKPSSLQEIPFLPIEFFKTHSVISENKTPEIIFKSSGTGGKRSVHPVAFKSLYTQSFNHNYYSFFGKPKDQVILALLPNYLEQGESSLIFMVDSLIKQTQNDLSGYILGDSAELLNRYQKAIKQGKQVVLFGVSYALLDIVELNLNLSEAIIIETGGMKGKRKELTKAELHKTLRKGLNCENISSEYGMTELLSQAYSKNDGIFETTNLMKPLIREVNDPFSYSPNGKTGGINIIDLANIYSCSFIATQDLGKIVKNGCEIMGRFDNSDIRGCNLLIQ